MLRGGHLREITRVLLIAGFAFAAAASARAQLPDMQVLADQMAQTISDSKLGSVVVIDFYGPDEKFSNLGVTLADRFNDSLKKTMAISVIQQRDQMKDWLKNKEWPLSVFKSIDLSLWVAGQLNIDAVIAGNISVRQNEIAVETNLYRVDTRQWVKTFEVLSRMSTEAQTLATTFPEPDYKFDAGIAVAGQNGYSIPTCVSCPEAPYNQDAIKHRTQGSVVMTAVIEADGSTGKLTVRQALPDGLTDDALETARQWKFAPATGPDGKPAPVQHTIRMTFHFSHERKHAALPPRHQ
jgi:TonB family protein